MTNYITTENILEITRSISSEEIIITDNKVVKELFNKYNPSVKVEHSPRKNLHETISRIKPTTVFLLFYSPTTISYINSILPTTPIYTIQLSEEDKITNQYVEELEQQRNIVF